MDMKTTNFRRAVVLGAHTDDEFGCSGMIQRLLDDNCEVFCVAFSKCEQSVPEGFAADVLEHEMRASLGKLGVPADHIILYDFPVRHFPSRRQEILEELVLLRSSLSPDLVLLPAQSDIHQDHHVISDEGIRAFKFGTVLGYELPMNTITFQHACFVELNESHLQAKIDAVKQYRSQQFRPYMRDEFIRSLAIVRGLQAGVAYAEAFEVLRLML
jgi:LmbE family N-acetylglucosaminyl deacetylase